MAQDITYIGLGDLTYKSTDDGTLMVYGVATDPTLDVDRQICDPTWLKQAMPQWFTSGANVREQHSSIAAGVGVELAADGDKWMLKSEVVDPVTQTKVRKKVLKGYSIGIKGAQVIKDDSAPNGRIVGGTIVEVSLVDRPANPSARIEIAKSVNGELTMTDIAKTSDLNADAIQSVDGDGDKAPDETKRSCHECYGQGEIVNPDNNERVTCPTCNGSGEEPVDSSLHHINSSSSHPGADGDDAKRTASSPSHPGAEKAVEGEIEKGDVAGHEFHGNQYSEIASKQSASAASSAAEIGMSPEQHENIAQMHEQAAKAHMMAAKEYSHDRSVKEVTSHVTAAMENQKAADAHRAAATSPSADGTSSAYEAYKASVNAAGRSSSADWTTHGSYLPGAKATEADLEKGGPGSGPRKGEGRLHTPAHEASRTDATEQVGHVKAGWTAVLKDSVPGTLGAKALTEVQDHISSGGTRDELQAKVDEARTYADKLAAENKQALTSPIPPDYPEIYRADQAEATARALELGANTWDTAAQMANSGTKGASPDSNLFAKGAEAYETLMTDLEKRAFSKTEREHAAISGQALPGGSFPIKNIQDLKNAIRSFGRAKDKDAAKSHIIARAKALGQTDLIPDNWKNTEAETEKADHNPADLESVRTALIALIKSELDEIARGEENEIPDVSELLTSLSIFLGWWDGEADEGEAPEPFATDTDDQPSGDDMAYIAMGVSPDLIKSATSAEATDEIRDELRTEIVKALGLDDSTTKAALAEAKEELTLLKAELAAVKEMAAPGGPALRQTQVQANKSGQVDQLRSEADRLRKTASQVIDTSLRNAYIEKALKLEHDADAIARN